MPPGWPPGEYDRFAAAYFHDRLLEQGDAVAPWYSWYAIRRPTADHTATLIGCGGYFGPPTPDGTVEIGYSVVLEWRRQGYAREMVQALTTRAFAAPEVRRILAEADVENLASIAVLTRCGFRKMGTGREPHFDRYQLDRIAAGADAPVGLRDRAPVSCVDSGIALKSNGPSEWSTSEGDCASGFNFNVSTRARAAPFGVPIFPHP